ncbi:MAG: GNAT family N-acetyltransferase [Pseudomonadota bacterium]
MSDSIRVEIKPGLPEPGVFRSMRKAAGWGEVTENQANAALSGSQFGVVARVGGEVIGFGRVVGDGALNRYIQDLIVAEDWRGRGVGDQILRILTGKIERRAAPGAMIGLFAAEGREDFYESRGFRRRPGSGYGAAMMKVVEEARV